MRGNSCARPQAAVPAVSENHPPVDRLLGGQHCGWLPEIRSEVSAPARLCPRNVAENRTLSSLLILGSGGRRLRTRACLSVERVRLRRALPAPAKEPQVPWNLLLLPPLRTTGTTNPSAGASRDHRGAAPSPRANLASETHPSSRAATKAAWTASPMRGSSCARPQAACRLFGRRALRTRAQAQAATTAAQRRRLAPTLHQKRTPAVEPPPRRRGLRRPCAAAAARGLRPPAASSDDGHCEPERRRKPRPPRRSAVASRQPCTRNAPQQSSRHLGGVDCVAYARQQLAAASGCT